MDDIFCKIINGEIPSLTCFENDYVKCIMDASPFNPGHTLIIPKKHFTTILDMESEYLIEIDKAAKLLIKKMEHAYPGLTGVRVIVNYGDEQKVKHYHMHLIPVYESNPSLTQEECCNLLKN